MNLEDGIKLDYSDVLIRPKRSSLDSRAKVNLERTFKFANGQSVTSVGIIASNMDGVGTFEMAKQLAKEKVITVIVKSYTPGDWNVNSTWVNENTDYVAVSIGTGEQDYKALTKILFYCPALKFICIDVANGYSEHFAKYCRTIREDFPDKILIAGNVATREMTEQLILNGVDIVKVGIGPGSVCTTRSQTGVGYPQLSAVDECSDAAHGLGGRIIADGGCNCPGDVAKAFGAGADFVMLGGMLSGCDEGGGEIIYNTVTLPAANSESYSNTPGKIKTPVRVKFYGMSSKEAQEKHSGGLKHYRSSEGKCVEIPYKGKVKDVLQDILGGLRSTCTYVGARNLKELDRCVTFIRVNHQINQVYEKF